MNSGMFFLGLAFANLVTGMLNNENWYDYWLCVALAIYGFKDLHIARSEELSNNYATEQSDERNQALDSLARDKAYTALRWLMFVFGMLLILLGAIKESDILLQVGFCNLGVYTLTFFLELVFHTYYNNKM